MVVVASQLAPLSEALCCECGLNYRVSYSTLKFLIEKDIRVEEMLGDPYKNFYAEMLEFYGKSYDEVMEDIKEDNRRMEEYMRKRSEESKDLEKGVKP